MDVYQIWTRDPFSGELWLVDAWDGDSIAANGEGYSEAIQKAFISGGAENVRVIRTVVDLDAVRMAFEVPTVDSKTYGAVND